MILKRTKKPIISTTGLDKKLVGRLRSRILPGLKQFKYLSAFLTAREKQIVLGALAVIIITSLAWGILFIKHHLVSGAGQGGAYSEALVGQPKYLNPLFANVSDIDSDLTSLTYSGLFGYDANQKLVPILAKNITTSPDGKTYDIEIKDGVKWGDGENLTADDVLFTFETVQNPEVGSPLFSSFQGIKIKKIDQSTIRFTLKEPFAPFLHSLTVGILPEHLWGNNAPGGLKLAKNNLEPMGTGAWLFDKLTKDNTGTITSLSLKPNPYYAGTKAHFNFLTFKFFSDFEGALEALRNQTVLALSFVPAEEKDKLPQKNFTFSNIHLPEYTALFFNNSQAPLLKNDDLRAALQIGIDKNSLIKTALQGEGEVVDNPLLGSLNTTESSTIPLAFDVAAGNALLDKHWARIQPEEYFALRQKEINTNTAPTSTANSAGTSTTSAEKLLSTAETNGLIRAEMTPDQAFFRKTKDNKTIRLSITTVDTSDYLAVAKLIVHFWHALGIAADVEVVSPRQIGREIIKPRDYEILLYGEIVGADPDPFPFWHSSQITFPGLNLSLYANRNVDKWLEDARVTNDESKRAALYAKFIKALDTDRPAIFLYSPYSTLVTNAALKGVRLPKDIVSPTGRFATLAEWYLNTTWQWQW